jgi:hypothetical protein
MTSVIVFYVIIEIIYKKGRETRFNLSNCVSLNKLAQSSDKAVKLFI